MEGSFPCLIGLLVLVTQGGAHARSAFLHASLGLREGNKASWHWIYQALLDNKLHMDNCQGRSRVQLVLRVGR